MEDKLKRIKLNESTISMILGVLVILVVGVLIFNYFRSTETGDTSQEATTTQAPDTVVYVVQPGEGLWDIAQEHLDDGFRWQEIAELNNIQDPNLLEPGQEIMLPNIGGRIADAVNGGSETQSSEPTNTEESTESMDSQEESEIDETEPTDDEDRFELSDLLGRDESEEEMIDEGSDEETSDVTESTVDPTSESTNTPVVETTATPTPEPTATIEPTATPMPEAEIDEEPSIDPGSTYTVKSGDSLWAIATSAYGDGFRWVDIAEANNLANPNIIHAGNQLILPE